MCLSVYFFLDRKTRRTALQFLRSFIHPLFLLNPWLAVLNVCVCVCVCVCPNLYGHLLALASYRKAPIGVEHAFCLTPTDKDSHSATIVVLCFAIVCVLFAAVLRLGPAGYGAGGRVCARAVTHCAEGPRHVSVAKRCVSRHSDSRAVEGWAGDGLQHLPWLLDGHALPQGEGAGAQTYTSDSAN